MSLKIIYKSSLNMPRGKIIAQASHALSSFVLGCFDFSAFCFKKQSSIDDLSQRIQNAELLAVTDEEFDASKFLIKIEDHGRTVFKGIPTITCGLVVSEADVAYFEYSPNQYIETTASDQSTRLLHVVNKAYARKDFNRAMLECVKLQSLHLLNAMQNKEFSSNAQFLAWAKGSFAKIVLVCNEEFITPFIEQLSSKALPYSADAENSVVVGPLEKEDHFEMTKELKMM